MHSFPVCKTRRLTLEQRCTWQSRHKLAAKAPCGRSFVHTEKLLAEVNKRVALTEDEAGILAHDITLWIAPKNEDCEKVNQR